MIKSALYQLTRFSGLHRWAYRRMSNHGQSIILCLHNVSEESNLLYPSMKPDVFRRLLRYLAEHFDIVSLDELVEEQQGKKPRLVITFDDGYKDFMKFVLPEIIELGIPSSLNVVYRSADENWPPWTNQFNQLIHDIHSKGVSRVLSFGGHDYTLGKSKNHDVHNGNSLFWKLFNASATERVQFLGKYRELITGKVDYMNWNDITECVSQGVQIGCHTYSHELLHSLKDESQLQREIVQSRSDMREKLGRDIDILAFPNGQYNQAVVQLARNAGYKYLLGTEEIPYSGQEEVLPRIALNSDVWGELIFKLHGLNRLI